MVIWYQAQCDAHVWEYYASLAAVEAEDALREESEAIARLEALAEAFAGYAMPA